MKKILITGAKGMLGQELMKVFKDEEVYGWDCEELDITDKNQVEKKIGNLRPDIIINAAAYNAVDKAESEKDGADLLNGYAVGYLAGAARAVGAVFAHYSTDYVFDGEKKGGYKEEDAPNPLSIYGSSKFLGEEETKKNADKFYVIRLSRLFGKPGSGQAAKKSFVDIMLDLAQTKKTLEVVDEELSSPTYAPDLAERTKYILENNLPFGIYHCANGGACTWCEFAREIFKQTGLKTEAIPVGTDKFPRPAKRPRFSILLNTKLPLMRDWQEALSSYLAS